MQSHVPVEQSTARLSRESVLGQLSNRTADCIELHVFAELESTNSYLLNAPTSDSERAAVALAGFQTAGRGRRGRTWNAPRGTSVCLSVGRRFPNVPSDLAALPLAAGVVVRRAVHALTGRSPQLKWPNDLVWDDRKLGGILVETLSEGRDGCYVVIGLGLNVEMDAETLRSVSDWPKGAIDLDRMTDGRPPDRAKLASRLIEELHSLVFGYQSVGFAEYHDDYASSDYLKGRLVSAEIEASAVTGTVLGTDRDGALILETGNGTQRITSGDVSVRPR